MSQYGYIVHNNSTEKREQHAWLLSQWWERVNHVLFIDKIKSRMCSYIASSV